MKRLAMLLLLTLLIGSGCAANSGWGKTADVDETKSAEIAALLSGLKGTTPDFQYYRSMAEWTPDGRAKIQSLMDEVLPGLTVTGKLPAGMRTDMDHLYARYGQDVNILFPVKTKNPEQNIAANIKGEWYALTGDKQKVGQLLDWASTQSIY